MHTPANEAHCDVELALLCEAVHLHLHAGGPGSAARPSDDVQQRLLLPVVELLDLVVRETAEPRLRTQFVSATLMIKQRSVRINVRSPATRFASARTTSRTQFRHEVRTSRHLIRPLLPWRNCTAHTLSSRLATPTMLLHSVATPSSGTATTGDSGAAHAPPGFVSVSMRTQARIGRAEERGVVPCVVCGV
jgi:hypothetical protein